MRKVAGNLGGPVVLLGIGKAGGGSLYVELLTCTMVRVVGGLIGVGGHKVLVVGPLTKSIMVILIEIAGLQGIAQGLRRRGIVDALQVKRTGAS